MPDSNVERTIINDIETLRGVSILLVLIAHLQFLLPWPNEVFSVTAKANFGIGVDLFFAISGFVISRSLFLEAQKCGEDRHLLILARFWIKRFFRLFPAAALTVLATVVAIFALGDHIPLNQMGGTSQTLNAAAASLLNVMNAWGWSQVSSHQPISYLAHFWSLSLEEQFYLLWPVLFAFYAKKPMRLAAMAIAIILAFTALKRNDFTHFWWWFRVDALFWGALVFIIRETMMTRLAASKNLLRVGFFVLIPTLVMIARMLGPSPFVSSCASAIAGSLILLASFNADALQSVGLVSKALNYLGTRSYTIYLWHLLIFGFVQFAWLSLAHIPREFSWNYAAMIVATTLPALTIIELSYRQVESRTRRFGASLASRLTALPSFRRKVSPRREAA